MTEIRMQSVCICGEMPATNPLSQETKINLECTYLKLSSYRAVNTLCLGNKIYQLILTLSSNRVEGISSVSIFSSAPTENGFMKYDI